MSTISLNNTFSTEYLNALLAFKKVQLSELKEEQRMSNDIQYDSIENEFLQENYFLDIQELTREITEIEIKLITIGIENIDIANAMDLRP